MNPLFRITQLAALTLLCAGCPGGRLSLGVTALPEAGASFRPVVSGQPLQAGEHYAIRIETESPAYLYVHRAPPEQPRKLVHKGRISQKAPVLLPAGGGLYRIEEGAAAEVLLVVASRRDLPEGELSQVLTHLADSRDPPPGQADPKSRGDDAVLRVRMDRRGIAALRFVIARAPE